MRVSFNWLKEYVDCELAPSELADLLTMAGLEIEGVEEVGPEFKGVVVAQITSIAPHPQADRLSLCRVKVAEKPYSIVCGARNMKEGDKVALALVGAELPEGVKIQKTTIRGELSEGMMCSEAELGFSSGAEGIMILPPEAPIGTLVADLLNVRDYVLEVSLTPNRGDCLSMIGVAREVAALTGKRFHPPTPQLREGEERVDEFVRVSVLDPDLCPRYSARFITGVQIGPSPLWLRTRLERAGVRSINNVVDVTNYVMLEYGQPLHAFDFDLLEGGEIVVKRAAEGERFVTLDEVERVLSKDTLMICDAVRPVAIGGVMGGLNSEIREDTSRVLLESAYFSPEGIRRTSTALGLQTESSYRFERGVDPEGVSAASLRAIALIAQLAGGEVAKGVIDCYPTPLLRLEIRLRLPRVNTLLGIHMEQEEVKGILKRLHMEVKEGKGDEWVVTSPTYRGDITREIDLIEEIGRLRGYDLIPVQVPKMWVLPFRKEREEALEEQAKEVLVGLGFYEVITFSFISPQSLEALRLPADDFRLHPLALLNPLAEVQSVMRTTLLPGLLETARYNLSHKNRDLKIFELREVYHPREGERLPVERRALAGLVMGTAAGEGWNIPLQEMDFYYVKGCVEQLLAELRTPPPTFTTSEGIPYLHPSKGAVIRLDGEKIGTMGELHPEVAEAFELPPGVLIFELDISPLSDRFWREITFTPLPRFPSVARDVAVTVDEGMSAGEITELIREVDNKYIEAVVVFDCYRGDSIPPGRKGLAFRIRYRSSDRTLTDEEVNEFHREVLERLEKVPELMVR
ncbi:MAG: phenylalanine--tRNA ligase subunit beta [Deltaproteobacteria bacterium RBG_13_52_11]|nr:MAG: phenylalanine--tRNA ligase subunit beta [Deltaproteobacteria bacterium RBG_13_52_11]